MVARESESKDDMTTTQKEKEEPEKKKAATLIEIEELSDSEIEKQIFENLGLGLEIIRTRASKKAKAETLEQIKAQVQALVKELEIELGKESLYASRIALAGRIEGLKEVLALLDKLMEADAS